MKQVQKTIGRWVQRITGSAARSAKQSPRAGRPVELDPQALRHVGGGMMEESSPVKGW